MLLIFTIIEYSDLIDTQQSSVCMVIDLESLEVMQLVGKKMGITIDVSAHEGERYSRRGDGEGRSLVPVGYCYIIIDPKSARINDFWDKVRLEKNKRRLAWLAANPITTSN